MKKREEYLEGFDDVDIANKVKKRLEDYKIDVFDMDNPYFNKRVYRDYFCNESIGRNEYGFLTYDYYIEKYIVGQERINNLKSGLFDIGTDKFVKSEKLNEQTLFNEIFDELYDSNPNDYANDEADYIKGIRNKFYDKANKGGIITQLKELYDIDLSAFNDEYRRLKLMKLLYYYCKTNKYGQKTNLHMLLSKPSFENVDSSQIEYENKNGDAVAFLKNEIVKEMDIYDAYVYNYEIVKCLSDWEDLLGVSVRYAYERNIPDLTRIAMFLEEKIVKMLPVSEEGIEQELEKTVFNEFYLKILEHEYISIKTDFVKINEFTLNTYKDNEIEIDKCDVIIKRHLIKSEIKSRKSAVIKALETVCSDEKEQLDSFINKNIKRVQFIVEWYEELYEVDISQKLPFLFIIAAYIAIKDAEKMEESLIYSYYRAPQSGKTLIVDKLNGSKKSEELFHRLWAKKTHFIYCCLCGYEEEMRCAIRIEKALDTIMKFFLVYHNINDYKNCNELLYNTAQISFIKQEIGLFNLSRTADIVNEMNGYKICIHHQNCEKLFRMYAKTSDVSLVAKGFVSVITTMERNNLFGEEHFPIEVTNQDGEYWFSGLFKVSIDKNKKLFNLIDYHKVEPDKLTEYYERKGLINFVWRDEIESKEYSISTKINE